MSEEQPITLQILMETVKAAQPTYPTWPKGTTLAQLHDFLKTIPRREPVGESSFAAPLHFMEVPTEQELERLAGLVGWDFDYFLLSTIQHMSSQPLTIIKGLSKI